MFRKYNKINTSISNWNFNVRLRCTGGPVQWFVAYACTLGLRYLLTYVDVDIEEIRTQSLCPFLTYNFYNNYYYYLKLSNCNFTAVSVSVNLSTKIVNNLLIFPEVIRSILETVYRFCRGDTLTVVKVHCNIRLLEKIEEIGHVCNNYNNNNNNTFEKWEYQM